MRVVLVPLVPSSYTRESIFNAFALRKICGCLLSRA